MRFKILYESRVVRDNIKRLSKKDKDEIKSAIENKLVSAPEVFGKPLRHSLRGYRKLRVGNYRVIFAIEGDTVKILAIGHRSDVYKWLQK